MEQGSQNNFKQAPGLVYPKAGSKYNGRSQELILDTTAVKASFDVTRRESVPGPTPEQVESHENGEFRPAFIVHR